MNTRMEQRQAFASAKMFLGRVKIFDPQSLLNPRPDRFIEGVTFKYPAYNEETLNPFGPPDALITQTGTVTIVIS